MLASVAQTTFEIPASIVNGKEGRLLYFASHIVVVSLTQAFYWFSLCSGYLNQTNVGDKQCEAMHFKT